MNMMREKRGSKIKCIYIIAFGNNVVDSSDSFFPFGKSCFCLGFSMAHSRFYGQPKFKLSVHN